MIDISGLDKAAVLAALYNNSVPLGMGLLHFDPTPMSVEDARAILNIDRVPYFDYLHGRVMKVDLANDELDPRLYDRDLGEGAAKSVIDSLR